MLFAISSSITGPPVCSGGVISPATSTGSTALPVLVDQIVSEETLAPSATPNCDRSNATPNTVWFTSALVSVSVPFSTALSVAGVVLVL